jgi:hypothetical protein
MYQLASTGGGPCRNVNCRPYKNPLPPCLFGSCGGEAPAGVSSGSCTHKGRGPCVLAGPPRAPSRGGGAAAVKPAPQRVSGRGHSTAYTHRHFPLPPLVQDCRDDPLAPARASNPHMPERVSIRNCSQDNTLALRSLQPCRCRPPELPRALPAPVVVVPWLFRAGSLCVSRHVVLAS